MQDWEIALLGEHLTHWFDESELESLYSSDRPAVDVAAELATYDFAFFCRYYLSDFFTQPPAEAHWDVFADIQWALTNQRSNTLAECLPRGFGKSTIISVGAPLWAIVGQDPIDTKGAARKPLKRYILIIKDSFDQAKLELQSIRSELEANEKLRRDFGDLVGSPWGKAEIVTSSNVKVNALGTGQKVRGRRHGPWRPDLVIADDLENDDTVLSPTQREKVKIWWARAVEKAGDPKTCDYICLATLIHYDCFQAWMLERPGVRSRKYKALLNHGENQDLWEHWEELLLNLEDDERELTAEGFYEANKPAMLDGASVSWPERFPYVILRQMQLGEKQNIHGKKINAFSAEMQNEPISDDDRLFKTIKYWHWEQERGIQYLVPDGAGQRVNMRICRLIGAADPSLGESHKGDFSAIIDLLISPAGRMFVAHASIERRHPDRIIDYIEARVRHWATMGMYYTHYGVESNQFQKLFASGLGQQLLASGIRLPIREIVSTHYKQARIDSLQPDLENGYLLLLCEPGRLVPEELYRLWEQLYQYPLGDFFDGPDALEMARTLAARGGAPRPMDLAGVSITSDPFGGALVGVDPFG